MQADAFSSTKKALLGVMAAMGTRVMHTVNSLIPTELNLNLIALTFEERIGSFYFFFFFKPVYKGKLKG